MDTSKNIQRDGSNLSPWQTGVSALPDNKISNVVGIYDCLIIGGGITGLTAALQLQQAGKQTILVEAKSIGFGTTGGTSAHINTFADTTYTEAESAFGEEGAQLFADAILEGFSMIKNNIDTYRIDCDYQTKPGYLYAEDDEQVKQLEDIYNGALKVKVAVAYSEGVPTPVAFKKALRFDGQAQFHPIAYLHGLTKAYVQSGGIISENIRIQEIKQEDGVHTAANIRARNVIYATHLPPNINLFNFECAAYRSYVLAVELTDDKYPEALIYDCQEPYHYVRTQVIDGQPLLLVGGEDHKTGHGDPEEAFATLEKYVRQCYNVSSVKYRWSSQYYIPVDGLPYIGQLPLAADGIYCATGYNGNGMMLGSIAGKILSDIVQGKESKYADLFSPARIKPVDGFMEFVKENTDVAYHFIADRFNFKDAETLNEVKPGMGKLIEVDGKKIAAYRDDYGTVHTLSPVCTHAGCIVSWNGEERSWDCPCHGARYDIDGNVLTGPATRNLAKL